MSGNASLAAAKRRRVGASAPMENVKQASIDTNGRMARRSGINAGRRPVSNNQGTGLPSPAYLIASIREHEARMNRLEQAHVESYDSSSLEARIEDLESAFRNRARGETEVASEDLAYLRDKAQNLDQQVADVKRLLLKVQSFAMETNLALMRLAKEVRLTQGDNQADAVSSMADNDSDVIAAPALPEANPLSPDVDSDGSESEEDNIIAQTG